MGLVQDHTYTKHGKTSSLNKHSSDSPAIWEEAMFYIHFLSLPTFALFARDITAQATTLAASPASLSIPLPNAFITLYPGMSTTSPGQLHIPDAVLLLGLNTLTQVLCAAGVNRLTTHVTSLTVTLVLVVRKAVSLLLSVAFFGRDARMSPQARAMLWTGATLVFAGTLVYTIASQKPQAKSTDKTK
jgi:UDP-xylose/UDP-N-acetylglucosamine transporter B4